jgi:Tol biopolymer transport system component
MMLAAAAALLWGCGDSGGSLEPPPADPGAIQVTAVTTGQGTDPDGYSITVDAGLPQAIGASGSVTVPALPAGDHTVELGGVAGNCVVTEENPRTVTVTAGATAETTFGVVCQPPTLRNEILFLSKRNTPAEEIWVMTPDGGNLRRLTNSFESEAGIAASPDGQRIAFARILYTCRGSDCEISSSAIWVMDADGANQVQLSTNPGTMKDAAPEWSPDGTRIVFESQSGALASELWIMDADGSNRTPLTDDGSGNGDPDWSPDGTRIAYECNRSEDGASDLCAINANGTETRNLTGGPAGMTDAANPAWSPDGSKIAFDSPLAGTREIWVMNADGSSPTRLTTHNFREPGNRAPTWSPDGNQIAFHSSTVRVGDDEIIAVMNADGTGQAALTTTPGGDSFPEWSRQ